MPAWVVWIVVACALGVGEIFTVSFFLGPFAVGALVAAAAAGVGLAVAIQLVVFLLVSLLALGLLRPIARRHLRGPARLRTGTAALIGERAVVVEPIDNVAGRGAVRLAGELWSARAFDEDELLEPGAQVHVMEIRGATALVAQ